MTPGTHRPRSSIRHHGATPEEADCIRRDRWRCLRSLWLVALWLSVALFVVAAAPHIWRAL